jgi:hypothetical protein
MLDSHGLSHVSPFGLPLPVYPMAILAIGIPWLCFLAPCTTSISVNFEHALNMPLPTEGRRKVIFF